MGHSFRSVTVRDALFTHWPVDADELRERIPDALSLSLFDGDAYLSIVAAEFADVHLFGLPCRTSVPHANLRTYVEHGDDSGIYFFSLDAGDPVVTATGRGLGLPCFRARTRLRRRGDERTIAVQRIQVDARPAHFAATYRPTGEPTTARPGSHESFLVERYRWFAGTDRLTTGTVDHAAWPLRPATAEIHSNTLFDAADLERPEGSPIVHYADSVAVTVRGAKPLRGRPTEGPIEIPL